MNNRTIQMRIKLFLIVGILLFVTPIKAQQVISGGASVDVDYLTPRTYEIGGITVEGADNLDVRMVQLIAGLKVGDQILVPGDKISTAIDKLWKQGMFEDVQITAPRIQNNLIFLNIKLSQRPRLSKFQFKGIKKSDVDKIREEIKLVVGDVVTENLITTSSNLIRAHYIQKGYHNVEVDALTIPDTAKKERPEVILIFDVKTHDKVKIKSLTFEGNSALSANTLMKEMDNTHDVNYWKKFYFWTSGFWKKSKYIESDYKSDLENIIEKYNEGLKNCNVQVLNHYDNNHSSSGHLYLVRLIGKTEAERNDVISKMAERGIACNVHYKPLPMMTAYKNLGFDIKDYPNAYNQYVNEVTLPLHTRLSDEDIEYIIANFLEIIQ